MKHAEHGVTLLLLLFAASVTLSGAARPGRGARGRGARVPGAAATVSVPLTGKATDSQGNVFQIDAVATVTITTAAPPPWARHLAARHRCALEEGRGWLLGAPAPLPVEVSPGGPHRDPVAVGTAETHAVSDALARSIYPLVRYAVAAYQNHPEWEDI